MRYFDDNLAQRFLVPLARLRDNQRLSCGVWQLSRMASCFIQRAGVREAGVKGFTINAGKIFMPALVALLCLLPTLSYAAVAQDIADDPVMEARMIKLAEKVRCLVCQSEPVSTSHSDWSVDVRQMMREKMKAGATDQQIMDLLVERFGKSVLFDPPVDKETMPLWSAPFVLLLIGGSVLVYQLRKRRGLIVEASLSAQDEQRAADMLSDSPVTETVTSSSNQQKDPNA